MSIITYHEAIALGEIIKLSRETAKIARVSATDSTVLYGTARAICSKPNGGFVGEHEDVREGYLWVTLRTGFEDWWPVRELMDEYDHYFTRYDWNQSD